MTEKAAEKVTVRSVMNIPTLCGARVLAGEGGLDREVRAVTVAEIPDISVWLQGGDFVHSVVWFMKDKGNSPVEQQRMCEWARSLYDAGAACLAIKTKRYVDRVPQPLLDLGNELDFPIIELPPHVIQNEVTQCVMNAILEDGILAKKQSVDAFSRLCAELTGGGGLQEAAQCLSEYLSNPVLIEDAEFLCLAAAGAPDGRDDALLEARRRPENAARILPQLGAPCPIRTDFSAGGRTAWQETWAITARNRTRGYISVLEQSAPITENDRGLIETSLGALALGFSQQQSEQEREGWRMRMQLFEALTAPQFDPERTRYLAEVLDLDVRRSCIALAVDLRRGGERRGGLDGHLGFAARCAADFFTPRHCRHLICGSDGQLLVLLDAAGSLPQRSRQLARQLWEHLHQVQPQADIAVGVGSDGVGLEACRKSCAEAIRVIDCVRRFGLAQRVMHFDELGQYALLSTVMHSEEAARSYCGCILGRLLSHAQGERADLLETLRVYLDSNCSYAETARVLFLHVNTVKYRLRQIEPLLTADLGTQDGRCTVWLALNIYRFLQNRQETIPAVSGAEPDAERSADP